LYGLYQTEFTKEAETTLKPSKAWNQRGRILWRQKSRNKWCT